MKKFKCGLAVQIVIGLILGIVVGSVFYGNPAVATYLEPIGQIFLNLIKMIVIPIVFSSLVVGVAGVGVAEVVVVVVVVVVVFENRIFWSGQ